MMAPESQEGKPMGVTLRAARWINIFDTIRHNETRIGGNS